MRGPVTLFAIEPGSKQPSGAALLAAKRTSEKSNDWRVETGSGTVLMKPFAAVDKEHYKLYQTVQT